ncbi:TBCC protein, partial [Polyodon spathula]|nr:TBCC protein [Polyodon spathula]
MARIPERLQKRDQERQEELERRKEAKGSKEVTEEKSDFFTSTFSKQKADIEDMLASGGRLEDISARIQQLQKFLNDSMVFLPQYELRQAQSALQKLQSDLAEKRGELLPKKKFAFRSRNVGANIKETPEPRKGGKQASTPIELTDACATAPPVNSDDVSAQCGFSNVNSQVLIKRAEEISQRDVLLTHLSSCTVKLFGAPSTLHIKHVRDSTILCGPVSSSVFIDHCSGCTFAFPCQQLRTHNTTDSQAYLHVTSRAIVEDCSGVRFAPFSWSYPGLEEDFQVSGLDRERNNWTQVDDFNWLVSDAPSPNWSVIPEEERKTTWD